MATTTLGPQLSSSRVVTLAELPDGERDAWIRFLAENRVSFFKDADGSYAGNVRLFDPAVLGSKGDGSLAAIGAGAQAQAQQQARARARGDGALSRLLGSFDAAAAATDGADARPYARYTSLLTPASAEPGGGGGVKPKPRQLSWVMRHVEELYDARYAKDTADLRSGDAAAPASSGGAGGGDAPVPFPAFVVEFFTKRYGLRSLIDQTCWDLLASVQALAGAHADVALFGRFLREECDPDDLLFFLYVRSVAQKELGVSFRGRWTALGAGNAAAGVTTGGSGAPAPLSLTAREAALVARVVYGSESDPLFRSFMATVEEHMAAAPAAAAAGSVGGAFGAGLRADAGAHARQRSSIDVTAFLTLSLEDYHATRPDAVPASASASASAAQQRGGAAAAAGRGAPSPSFAPSEGLLAALGEAIHASNERLITRLLLGGGDSENDQDDDGGAPAARTRAQGFASLPDDLRGNIVGELQAQLEGKVDAVLAGVIEAAQAAAGGGGPTAGAAGAEGELCGLFSIVLASGGSDPALLDAFCNAVLAHEDVRGPMADLATVMVSYAVNKWHGGGGGSGDDDVAAR